MPVQCSGSLPPTRYSTGTAAGDEKPLHQRGLQAFAHRQLHVLVGDRGEVAHERPRDLAQPVAARRERGDLEQPRPDRVTPLRVTFKRAPGEQAASRSVELAGMPLRLLSSRRDSWRCPASNAATSASARSTTGSPTGGRFPLTRLPGSAACQEPSSGTTSGRGGPHHRDDHHHSVPFNGITPGRCAPRRPRRHRRLADRCGGPEPQPRRSRQPAAGGPGGQARARGFTGKHLTTGKEKTFRTSFLYIRCKIYLMRKIYW